MKQRYVAFCLALVFLLLTAAGALPNSAAADPGRIYVDADAVGSNDGSSWATAYARLQDALAGALSGDQIWVAGGTYRPDEDTANPGGTGDREASFRLVDGVALYGGFAGGESSLGERDWEAHPTILTGDLLGDDGPDFANNGENSYHVVTGMYPIETAVLDGFSISGGFANGSGEKGSSGGGMCNEGGDTGECSPIVTNCTFVGNKAGGGGGMWNMYNCHPTVTNCIFRGNAGGGMTNMEASYPDVANCTFSGNTGALGGGMSNLNFSGPNVTNCTFSGNAGSLGGGIYNENGCGPQITNCTFSGNMASFDGGGMHNFDYSHPTMTNCIFWGNSDSSGAGESAQIFNYWDSHVHVNYACVEGWTGLLGGTGNTGDNPLLADADGPDGIAGTADDNLRLSPGSPCVDAGSNAAVPAGVITDIDGNPRIVDGDVDGTASVDMGAYESAPHLTAVIDVEPGTLNLRSSGKTLTVYTELPAGQDVSQIDISSIRLNGTIPALAKPTAVGDYDRDGIPDLMVKFNRAAVQQILSAGDHVEVSISGKVAGVDFEGADTIRVAG